MPISEKILEQSGPGNRLKAMSKEESDAPLKFGKKQREDKKMLVLDSLAKAVSVGDS